MVTKHSFLTGMVLALTLGVMVPGGVSAVTAPCPDYSGKIVKVASGQWLILDGQRWRLVDSEASATWGKSVTVGRQDCVETLPDNGGMLSYRAGTRLIRKEGTVAVYATGMNGAIHLIDSPDVAAQWYGPRWGSLLRTVSVETFNKYRLAEPVTPDRPNNGTIVRQSGQSRWYQMRDGQLMRITGLVPAAIYNNTRVLPAAVFNVLPMSTATIAATDVLTIKTPNNN